MEGFIRVTLPNKDYDFATGCWSRDLSYEDYRHYARRFKYHSVLTREAYKLICDLCDLEIGGKLCEKLK